MGIGSSSDIVSLSPLMIRRGSEEWHSPGQEAYDDEGKLKLLLRDFPRLLPTYRPGIVVIDELTVPLIGSVDLVAAGPDGSLTLVECKLSSNPEIRRSIVGQIFAYAAGLWRLKYEDFDRLFTARAKNIPLADAIRAALPAGLQNEWSEEDFRLSVSDNLTSGRFTLIVAVDRITDELKKVVPYINSHTLVDIQFLALEIRYVRDGDVEVIQPLTYGQESVAEKKATTQRQAWTPDAYFEQLQAYAPETQQAIDALVTFSKEHGAQLQGGSGARPSLNVQFCFGDKKKTVWSSYISVNGPTFDLNFDYVREACLLTQLEKCAEEMRRISGVSEKYAMTLKEDFQSRPSLPVNPILLQPGAVDRAIAAVAILLTQK